MVKTEQTPEFFQSVVKYSSDLITIISQDGLYKYVSDSVTRLLGYTADEMLESSPFQHVHEDDLAMVLSNFQNIATTDQLKLPAGVGLTALPQTWFATAR
jgi:PAS domain S-box-containing protein